MNIKKIILILIICFLFVFLGVSLYVCNKNNTEDNILSDKIKVMYKQIDKDKSNYIVLNDGISDDKKILVKFFLGDFSYSDGYVVAVETSNYKGIYKINVEDGTSSMVIERHEIEKWVEDNGFKKSGSVYQPEISVDDIERVFFKISIDNKLYVCKEENSEINILFETDASSQYTIGSDKRTIFGVSNEKIISYNLITGEIQTIVERPSDGWISVNSDGTKVAYQDNGLYLYDVRTKTTTKICDDERFSNKIVFSDDGKYLACSVLHYGLFTTPDYGTLYVYDMQNGCTESVIKLNNEGQSGYFDLY